MTLRIESKIRVLEDFVAIDYALFGKPVAEVIDCCPFLAEDYISLKGALMSTIIEMFKLVDHCPEVLEEKVSEEDLLEMAKDSASIAKANAKRILASERSLNQIKIALSEEFKEEDGTILNIGDLVKERVKEKAFSFALDNLLISRTLEESKAFGNMDGWEGKILMDSYKILRDELSMLSTIIDDDNIV